MDDAEREARRGTYRERYAADLADLEQQRALAPRRANGHLLLCVCPECYEIDSPELIATARRLYRLKHVPVEHLWDSWDATRGTS